MFNIAEINNVNLLCRVFICMKYKFTLPQLHITYGMLFYPAFWQMSILSQEYDSCLSGLFSTLLCIIPVTFL